MTSFDALQRLHNIQLALLLINHKLDQLDLKEKKMPLDPTIAAVIAQIDAATTAVATRIQKLIDKANSAGSVSAADVVAALQPEVDRLTLMGQDPTNPVPDPPPPPPGV